MGDVFVVQEKHLGNKQNSKVNVQNLVLPANRQTLQKAANQDPKSQATNFNLVSNYSGLLDVSKPNGLS